MMDAMSQAAVGTDSLPLTDVRRRLKAILIGSIGNLVEWYDFYAYTAFALYFANSFFPGNDPVRSKQSALPH
jgi:MFS transporter, MHS family, alpha-ketoglutarate permease